MPRTNSVFSVAPSIRELQFIIRVLNSEDEGLELRRLVKLWQRVGLVKMLADEKALRRPGQLFLVPTAGIGGKLMPLPREAGRGPLKGKRAARTLFTTLVIHPLLAKFGGPCARCHKYYLKKKLSQKVYCSRQCGSAATAMGRTTERRREKHEQDLQRARQAARRWTSRASESWKEFVSKETELTVRWISRAVNKGELQAPPP